MACSNGDNSNEGSLENRTNDENDGFRMTKMWTNIKVFFKNTSADNHEIHASMPVDQDDLFYNMNHKKRGMALIFMHENFETSGLEPRKESTEDCKKLKKYLANLSFDVQEYKDLKYKDIENHIIQASQRNYKDHDCIIILIVSYGEQGWIYAKDILYNPDILWSCFTPNKCPTLAGKPKIFFIQASKGDRLDLGVKICNAQADGDLVSSYKIPLQADFLIMHSNVKGSRFIDVLTEELNAHAYKRDLLTILTFVNQRVAIDFDNNGPDAHVMDKENQITSFTSQLIRFLQFEKKKI